MKSRADYLLLSYFIVLLVFGLIMLTSASAAVAHEQFNDNYFFIKKQLLLGVLPGLVLFLFFSKFNYLKLKKFSLLFFGFSCFLLLLVFVPGIGSTVGTGSKSWLIIFGHSFQPAEFAKLGLIVYLSAILSNLGKEILDFKNGFLRVLEIGLIPIVLILLQPDVGTVLVMFAILLGMIFIAGAKFSHISGLVTLGLVGLILLVLVAPYRAERFTTFLHPELDPQGKGYQINQAFLAIGSGGFFGKGLGHSLQKFQYLPEVTADSIYAVIAEEMGFIFALGLVILYVLICSRGTMLAKNAPDQYSRLVVSGIIIWFGVQSFLNIGAMVGVLPLTGLPLPFVSHGGTALAIAMGAVGVLVNVSKQTG